MPKPETVYVCQSCRTEFVGLADFEPMIGHAHERVAPGEIMPWGECPECGGLVHRKEKVPEIPRKGRTVRACWNCGKEMHENLGVYCYDCAPLLLPPEDGRPFREVPWSRDTGALDQIHALLDGEEWGSQTLETVAQIIEATGRKIREPDEEDPDDADELTEAMTAYYDAKETPTP